MISQSSLQVNLISKKKADFSKVSDFLTYYLGNFLHGFV